MDILAEYLPYLILGLCVLVIIFIILTFIMMSKLKKISKNSKNGDLGAAIESYYNKVEALTSDITGMSERFSIYEAENQRAFKKIGVKRYNAFGDISGNMSFSIAMLNGENDGFIMTSLYGHNNCCIYFRDVKKGVPNIMISEEEGAALEQAMEINSQRIK